MEGWRRAAERVQCGCPLWLTVVLHSVWEEERGGAGPKTDMLSSVWMPSNHSSSLPLLRSVPPPPAGPSLQFQLRAYIAQWLFNTQGIATSHAIDVKCSRLCPLQWVETTPDVSTITSAATDNCTVHLISSGAITNLTTCIEEQD